MAVDLFQALGVDAPTPTQETPPSVRVAPTPSTDKGIDLFNALGVDRAQTFQPSNPLPAGAKPDARMPLPSTVSRGPDLPAWAGGGVQPTREPVSVAPQKETLGNLAGAVPSGLYEGVARVPNIPTDLVNAASGVMHGLTGQDYGRIQQPFETNPTGYQPQGKLAQGIHDASSAAANTVALGGAAKLLTPFLPAGSAASAVSHAVESPSKGVVAASAAGGAAEEPVARQVPEEYQPLARMGANILTGGVTAGAESALGNAARSSITPQTAALARFGRDTYDIPITAAQMSGNRIVKTADSVLKSIPFSGHGDLDHETQLAVNSAVSRTFGEDAPKITPAVMSQARTRIGGVLQDVETRNPVNFDQQTIHDLASIEANARSSLTDPEYGVIQRQLDGVMSNVQPGNQIAGTTYGNLMHKGTPLDAAANSKNPNVANYAGDIKDALRASLQRSLTGDDAAAYQQARTQWKNMKTVEPLTQSADVVGGASPSTGDINPTLLRAVVNRSYKDVPYRAPGEIPLNDIADIAQRFLKEPGTSHTSERGWLMHLLTGAGAGIFGVEHGLPSVKEAALGAGALGATGAMARGVSGVLQSDALANRMIRQGLAGPQPGIAQSVGRAAVPLATTAGVRQLEPPEEPSTNPATGLPQFSLQANQIDHKRRMADQIVNGLKDGSLASPDAMKNHITQNKRDLRGAFGGQGLQNIMFVQAMMRRPSNLFSVVSSAPTPAIQAALGDANLASLAILSPELAKTLATSTSRQNLTKAGEAQVVAGIQRATQGTSDDNNNRNPAGLRNGLQRGGDMGKDRFGAKPGLPQPVATPNTGAAL